MRSEEGVAREKGAGGGSEGLWTVSLLLDHVCLHLELGRKGVRLRLSARRCLPLIGKDLAKSAILSVPLYADWYVGQI
jgi:hypothetical protein